MSYFIKYCAAVDFNITSESDIDLKDCFQSLRCWVSIFTIYRIFTGYYNIYCWLWWDRVDKMSAYSVTFVNVNCTEISPSSCYYQVTHELTCSTNSVM